MIGANDIKDNAIRSRHIKAGQVKASDLAAPQEVQDVGLTADDNGDCTGISNQWAAMQPDVFGPLGYYLTSRDAST